MTKKEIIEYLTTLSPDTKLQSVIDTLEGSIKISHICKVCGIDFSSTWKNYLGKLCIVHYREYKNKRNNHLKVKKEPIVKPIPKELVENPFIKESQIHVDWVNKIISQNSCVDVYDLFKVIEVYDYFGGKHMELDDFKPAKQIMIMWQFILNNYRIMTADLRVEYKRRWYVDYRIKNAGKTRERPKTIKGMEPNEYYRQYRKSREK